MDTHIGECRICGDDTDLIEGICQECNCHLGDFEKWQKECASNCTISEQDKELFVAYLRTL